MEAQMQEIKALADEMMIILSGCQGEVLLQNAMNYKAKMVNVYMEVEQCVKQQLREIQQSQEHVAQEVINVGEEREISFLELQKIKEKWKETQQQNSKNEMELELLQKELEELEKSEKEMSKLEEEVDENTTVVIPSTKYLAHIFHKVTKIIWDYDCDPSLVRGVHFGVGLAQPINIDSTKHSDSFICDYLWSLVSTDW
ncbi:kinetochore protein Spc24 [Leucoraja erinacea]|uniref:kinetochore protein Spc24 n=1 Tax=Leucoraja erinaceus TaxID=7782 RepID=UPI0024561B53|nr:kinetochore protein Spc24 [Leucoraja erinacea]XP_055520204.1 kinetochore protein Spc24 [Leucoraja erinacea]